MGASRLLAVAPETKKILYVLNIQLIVTILTVQPGQAQWELYLSTSNEQTRGSTDILVSRIQKDQWLKLDVENSWKRI